MDRFTMESPIDLRQTPEYAEYMSLIGWKPIKVFSFQFSVFSYIYIKKIPLLPWSIGKLQRPVGPIDWELVAKIRKKYRIIKLITEEMVAKKTMWVDLRKSEKELLGAMKPKTRYNIGLAKRRGIKIKIANGKWLMANSNTRNNFFELLHKNSKRLNIFSMPQKWFEAQVKAFGEKCFGVLALRLRSGQEAELLAGNFFMTSRDGCFYAHNGSTEWGRKLMAPTLCTWEGMREAKRRKLKVFDFEGIYDGSRVLRRWRGFTRFKKGFGGEEIIFS